MKTEVIFEALNGLKVLQPEVFEDERGFFCEVYRKDIYTSLGIPDEFVQDNHSRSGYGVLRGLHFQWDPPMGKLMRVTRGEAYLVAVDVRKGSPTLGHWHGELVSASNKKLVYAPAGFARGFCVTSEVAEIQYKCTGVYSNKAESGIRWNDPQLSIDWPVTTPTLSARDINALPLEQWLASKESDHFKYKAQ
jgi:dTDP-4-dehydrorhamnose 3,5-epimerase